MIDDETRRKVAQELRKLTTPGCIRYAEEFYDELREIVACDLDGSFEGVANSLADLIDRPTATASMDYEAMEDGLPDCRIWTCHRCNESFPVYRGFIPAYCQNCGAEVVDA